MYIEFSNSKLKRVCEDINKANREWGTQIARKLIRRLNEIKAAECLNDLGYAPPTRCHQLTGSRKGQYAVDLEHPFRLIFEPIIDNNLSLDCLDYLKITQIRILEVTDYHGK